MSSPEQSSFLQRAKMSAVGVGVAVAGLAIYNNFDNLPECVKSPGWDACMPDADIGRQAAADTDIGDFEKVFEDQTGTVAVQTFGEVAIGIGGTKSTLDYDEKSLWDFAGDVDATMYWNRRGDSVQKILYNPCIRTDEDYSNAGGELPKTIDGKNPGAEPRQAPSSVLNYKIDVVERGDNAGKVSGVTVNSGVLDTCYVRMDEGPENYLNFTYNGSNQTSVGTHEDATFRWMVNSLALAYAKAEACPEEVVDMEAVREKIARTVLGDAVAAYPELAQELAKAHDEGKFDVKILSPQFRSSYYRKQLAKLAKEIDNRERSFPNERQDNETYPMNASIGGFKVTKCSVSEPVSVTRKGE